MLKPLLRVAMRDPRLLLEHLEAYVELAGSVWQGWQMRLRMRVLLGLLAFGALMIAIIFLGVALMLQAIAAPVHWMVWVVPAVPALVALVAALAAMRRGGAAGAGERLAQQIREDARMLREWS